MYISYLYAYWDEKKLSQGIIRRERLFSHSQNVFSSDRSRYFQNVLIIHFGRGSILDFNIGYDNPPPLYKLENRQNNCLFMSFVSEGKGKLDGREFGKGDFYYIPINRAHTLEADKNDPWKLNYILLRGKYADVIQNILESRFEDCFASFDTDTDIRSFFGSLINNTYGEFDAVSFVNGFMTTVLSFLHKQSHNIKVTPNISARSLAIADEARKIIEMEYDTITVDGLAGKLHIDRKYLCLQFKRARGISPQDYLIDYKLKIVATYLIETDYPIQKIVELSGYGHRNSLMLAFRGKYGCTMTQFREKYRNGEVRDEGS